MVEVGSVIVILQFPASTHHLLKECIELYKKRPIQVKQKSLISMWIEEVKAVEPSEAVTQLGANKSTTCMIHKQFAKSQNGNA